MVASRFRIAALSAAALAVVACAKKDNATVDSTTMSETADTSAMTASSTNTGGTWSDANIFALLDEANAADSSAGAVAATKGTAAAVRSFAKDMMQRCAVPTARAILNTRPNPTPSIAALKPWSRSPTS